MSEQRSHPLTRIREQHNLTQDRLAEVARISARTIMRAEQNKLIAAESRRRLCEYFAMTAEELGLMIPSQIMKEEEMARTDRERENVPEQPSFSFPSPATAQQEETPSSLANAIAQGILLAVQELERQGMDTSRRTFIHMLSSVAALAEANKAFPTLTGHLLKDHLPFFEQKIATQWDIYHTGGTIQAYHGLSTFFGELQGVTHSLKGSLFQRQAFTSLCMGYQLEGSLYRDMMKYENAHTSYLNAFEIAQEFDDLELKAAALARRGVTHIQQSKPDEAIEYLQEAGRLIKNLELPYLAGYIFQALSEAYATIQQAGESERYLDVAQRSLAQQRNGLERSHCQANTTSVTAQRGVNAVHLQDYSTAITLLEQGLANYNPTLLRGRARLKAQKAEAEYGLGFVDICCQDATEAWILARSAGSNKTLARLRTIQKDLVFSPWKREKCVSDLNWTMTTV